MFLGETAAPQAHFELPVLFNAVAHFTFGVTGALAGLRRGYDYIGVIMLALITAGGGGLIRDGLLISRGPAMILTDTDLIYVVIKSPRCSRLRVQGTDREDDASDRGDRRDRARRLAVSGSRWPRPRGRTGRPTAIIGTPTSVGSGLCATP
jgi:hypothetical protein